MYVIDSKTQVNLKHVEKLETNDINNSIILEMVSGRTVAKEFDTPELAVTGLAALIVLIDGI